jgi:putative ABC transport system ATP-binding protein
LINHPGLVLADEPTGNLDPAHSKEVLNLMFQLNKELGIAFVMVTHDMEIAARAMTHYRLQNGILNRV